MPIEYDDSRYSDTVSCAARDARTAHGTAWNSAADGHKVLRKGAKVRMTNPAALLTGKAGLTYELDRLNGLVNVWYGRKLLTTITKQQIIDMINED